MATDNTMIVADTAAKLSREERKAISNLAAVAVLGERFDEGVVGGDGGEALVCFGEGVDSGAVVDGDETEPGEHANATVLDLG